MATPSEVSVGLAHELVITACKAGFEVKDLTTLSQSEDKLRQVLSFLRGNAEIAIRDHLINLDTDPFIPEGWQGVEEHQKGGELKWDPKKIEFYLSSHQKGEKYIEGNKLRKELAGEPVLNANLLDYLLKHPHLIPDDWKKDGDGNIRYIYFWGTIYRDSDGDLCVRYLYWYVGCWRWGYAWLGSGWDSRCPAALLAE